MSDFITKDVKRFSEIEKEMDLFSREYEGFPYWQSIRFAVCESIFDDSSDIRMGKRRRVNVSVLIEVINSMRRSLKERRYLKRCGKQDVLIFRGKEFSDRFFDTWNMPEGARYINFRYMPYQKENRKDIHYLEGPLIQYKILYYLDRLFHRTNDEQESLFLKSIEERLLCEFGRCMGASRMEALIRRMRLIDRAYSRFYQKLLDVTECAKILLVCYYDSFVIPLIKVAKKKDVQVIEFQHGVINYHEQYWFEDTRGLHNYTPDLLLTFGEQHNEWISLVDGEKAVAVGYPFQNRCILQYASLETDDKTIVIYPDEDARFERVINEFIDIITKNHYKVYIKVHPSNIEQVESYYPLLSKNKNAEIIRSADRDVYYWLKIAKHHVMASTTVALEALAFPHTNICIATNVLHHQTKCLIEWGVARGFSTSEELIRLIDCPPQMDDEKRDYYRKRLWKEKAADNIESLISKLIKNEGDHTT